MFRILIKLQSSLSELPHNIDQTKRLILADTAGLKPFSSSKNYFKREESVQSINKNNTEVRYNKRFLSRDEKVAYNTLMK